MISDTQPSQLFQKHYNPLFLRQFKLEFAQKEKLTPPEVGLY